MSPDYTQLFKDACDYVDAVMPVKHIDPREVYFEVEDLPPCVSIRRATDAEIHARFDRIIAMLSEPIKRAALALPLENTI